MEITHPPLFLYERILGDIESRIVSGQWLPGHAIPSETELGKTYGCSRMTVNKALTQLARKGLIERRRRTGTRVARPRTESAVLDVSSIESEVLALGLPYRYRLLSCQQKSADASTPSFSTGAALLFLRSLHFAGNAAFCLEQRIINLEVVPEAKSICFDAQPPGAWLIQQVPWSAASHVISAEVADEENAALLEVPEGAACLVMCRETTTPESVVITSARLTYPGARHTVRAKFTPGNSG